MPNKKMSSLTIGANTYEITDAEARQNVKTLSESLNDIYSSYGDMKTEVQNIRANLKIVSDKVFAESPQTWNDVQNIVREGMAMQYFSIGDQLICNHTKYGELVWDIIDFDHDVPTDTTKTHSMSLQLHNPIDRIRLDNPEAFYFAENGLAAGVYHISIPADYDGGGGSEGKSYWFTLTKAVPAGGQVLLSWEAIRSLATTARVITYADSSAINAIETTGYLVEGAEGTALTFQNQIQAARFGSNRWKESCLRQWLNSAAAAGAWWTPQHAYDRPYSADLTGKAGFLYGMDADFLAVVGTVTKRTILNNKIGGGYDELTERFFLPSRSELYGLNQSNPIEGEAYAYYGVGYSSLSVPGTGADSNRIRYKTESEGGTASGYWLRSCSAWDETASNSLQANGSIATGVFAYGNSSVAPICNII